MSEELIIITVEPTKAGYVATAYIPNFNHFHAPERLTFAQAREDAVEMKALALDLLKKAGVEIHRLEVTDNTN